MSKSPAWNAYNDTTRKVNDDYEAVVKPLRNTLSKDIANVETRLDAKIQPLLIERKTLVDELKEKFTGAVTEAQKVRQVAMSQAQKVLNAERNAERTAAASL